MTQVHKKPKLGRYLTIALILGLAAGQLLHMNLVDREWIQSISDNLNLVSSMFLRLIKMIIAPLVFATLVAGMSKLGDSASLGRIFLKSMIVFLVGGFFALILGALLVEVFKPGEVLHNLILSGNNASAIASAIPSTKITLKSFVEGIIPASAVEGFVANHIIQVVLFAIFFGVGTLGIGSKGTIIFDFFDSVSHVMFKVTGYIMLLAPIAVFTSITHLVMGSGIAVIYHYLVYILEFYFGLVIIWVVYLSIGYIIAGRRFNVLLKSLGGLFGISFASASSEVALPGVLVALEKFGVSPKIGSFVLPLGYSFNLTASMLNCTFATIFIIQLYGYSLTLTQEVIMLLMLMVTSKGMAGVPRASLVIVATTLTAFGYPETGVLVLLPIDSFLDMGRSATNVLANAMSVLMVDRWEKKHNHH
jgi:Na+/H+-dicarboxylate symporter